MRVLFLTEWYPHRDDSMFGLFVRKHALAAAKAGVEVCVLYMHHDSLMQRAIEIEENTEGNLCEIRVYYRSSFRQAAMEGYKRVLRDGKPDLCQLNIIGRSALLAHYLRLKHHIPYFIVEHWSGYLPQNGAYENKPFLTKRFFRYTVKHALAVLTVSEILERNMKRCRLNHPHYGRIRNVVEPFFFAAQERRSSTTLRLLHVSCFDERSKNVCGLVQAVSLLARQRQDFCLHLVGTGKDIDQAKIFARQLQVPDNMLCWRGELEPQQVAQEMREANLFVLFSNYETAGVVLSESMAAGLPIVSTPVGIAPEVINVDTGLLTPVGDSEQLMNNINFMLGNLQRYSPAIISKQAQPFSEKAVGQQLRELYDSLI